MVQDKIRAVRLSNGRSRWTVTLLALGGMDWRGAESCRVVIRENGSEVYAASGFSGSPLHATDSDETMRAVISLACHDATHDEDDARRECEWDVEGLEDAASIRWPDA